MGANAEENGRRQFVHNCSLEFVIHEETQRPLRWNVATQICLERQFIARAGLECAADNGGGRELD